ncbi:hypothetical protein Vadar_025330 [Vaccinium darrowii]|uniref:Uncharacterized protein n=1 Tax=Vaccinium darrowii TaxID=229202 RepID=A0ACB7Y8N8_9ERIC|nr:hypothetical protein Vadar_025330 [Vaccinium darrowii]
MKPIKLISSCPNDKRGCVKWVEKYFKDCLCNLNDDISFGLGLVSFVSWGAAEIPQIITNFGNKSGSGVSLAFLSAWIVGDIFNLVGCVLDPATLPTQFYTALLYTTTTVILVLQCIYYDYLLRWWNCRNIEVKLVKDESKHLKSDRLEASKAAGNSPVEVPHHRKFYYTSARSMAGSDTPPFKSYIKAKSGPSTLEINVDSSSEDETTPAPPKTYSQPQRIPRSVGYGTFLATSANLPFLSGALTEAYLKTSGRRLLQGHEFDEEYALGEWLGWLMAAIYMGGRIPQIWLNIKRGSVENQETAESEGKMGEDDKYLGLLFKDVGGLISSGYMALCAFLLLLG